MIAFGGIDWSDRKLIDGAHDALQEIKKALSFESSYSKNISVGKSDSNHDRLSLLPSRVAVVGSFLTRTMLATQKNIDIVAYMPVSWCDAKKLTEKNYICVRTAFIYFLSKHLSEILTNSSTRFKIQICISFGEKTCVSISDSISGYSIRIHTALDAEIVQIYKANQINLCNISEDPLKAVESVEEIDDDVYRTLNRIEDSILEFTLSSIYQIVQINNEAVLAITLLKSWLSKYDMLRRLPSHLVSLLVCVTIQRINSSNEKVIKDIQWDEIVMRVLALLASAETFHEELRSLTIDKKVNKVRGLTLISQDMSYMKAPRSFPLSFRITSDDVRQVSSFTVRFYEKLQHATHNNESEKLFRDILLNETVSLLSTVEERSTGHAFWKFFCRNDTVLSIRNIGKFCGLKDLSKFIFNALGTAKTALASRIKHIDFFLSAQQKTNDKMEGCILEYTLYVGLLYDPSTAVFVNITKGPAHGVDTSEFLQLWGSHNCAHRRFADGSVHVTRVWKSKFPEGVLLEILRDVWQRHQGIPAALVYQHLPYLEPSLLLEDHCMNLLNKSKHNSMTVTKPIQQKADVAYVLKQAIGVLRNYMYSLHENGFPVKVQNLLCGHPSARGTSVWTPKPHAFLLHTNEKREYNLQNDTIGMHYGVDPIPVSVELGKHALWPNDVSAVEQLIASLGVDLCRIMRKNFGVVSVPGVKYVTVIILGYAFRISLWYKNLSQLCLHIGEKDRSLELDMQNKIIHEHHAFIQKIIEEAPAVRIATRLLLRLVSHHLPYNALPIEAVELLVSKQVDGVSNMKSFSHPLVILMCALDFIIKADFTDLVDLKRSLRQSAHQIKDKNTIHFITPYSDTSPFTISRPTAQDLSVLKNMALHCLERMLLELKMPSIIQQNYSKPVTCLRDPESIVKIWKHSDVDRLTHDIEHFEIMSSINLWHSILFKPIQVYDFRIFLEPKLVGQKYTEAFELLNTGTANSRRNLTMNIYEKGSKDRSELLHAFLAYEPVKELISMVHKKMPGEVVWYYDENSQRDTKRVLSGCLTGPALKKRMRADDKKNKINQIVRLLGDAVHSHEVC